jgi:hypothetical protein
MTLKVMLREDSKWVELSSFTKGADSCNPLNMEGVIIAFDGETHNNLYLRVQWTNGYTNWYSKEDLKSVE